MLELQKRIIYGPVNSRRLGRSLGINILSPDIKICTFNCIYCQYGWTGVHQREVDNELTLPSVDYVLKAVKQVLINNSFPPAYITFSGNGEPSLHPDFSEVVDGIIKLRDQYSPSSKTAILSNSTTVSRSDIQQTLLKIDTKIMKLDCGSEKVFNIYNLPCLGVDLNDITEALSSLENVTIQALFSGGPSGNFEDANIAEWVERIVKIAPIAVQIYTLDRETPSESILLLKREQLLSIKTLLNKKNISAEVY